MLRRALLVLFLVAAPVAAQDNPEWVRPFPPFRIIGNVYWVGTYDLASYLITTDAGHVLINSGLAATAPQIAASIEQLGFDVQDVEYLLATHAHYDHAAGLAELKRLTGAQMLMSEADAVLLEDGGRSDFHFGNDAALHFAPVQVERRLQDQDTITLGKVTLTAHHHPGHTRGATSFTFTVREAGRDYDVIIANMGTINPGVDVRGIPAYPQIATDYARTFAAQKALDVDVFLASHAGQFGLHRKYRDGDAYDPGRFVDPAGYRAAVERFEGLYREQLAREP